MRTVDQNGTSVHEGLNVEVMDAMAAYFNFTWVKMDFMAYREREEMISCTVCVFNFSCNAQKLSSFFVRRYSVRYPSDMNWGSLHTDGTWNGLVMETVNKVSVVRISLAISWWNLMCTEIQAGQSRLSSRIISAKFTWLTLDRLGWGLTWAKEPALHNFRMQILWSLRYPFSPGEEKWWISVFHFTRSTPALCTKSHLRCPR